MATSNVRRTIIREWMLLARDKRQSAEQARAFTKTALQRHRLPRSRQMAHAIVMAWLGPPHRMAMTALHAPLGAPFRPGSPYVVLLGSVSLVWSEPDGKQKGQQCRHGDVGYRSEDRDGAGNA
jgi:hypothetical protein